MSINMARIYVEEGAYRKAADICTEILHSDGNNAEALCYLGIANRGLGKSAAAIRFLKKAIEIDPGNSTAKQELYDIENGSAKKLTKSKGKKEISVLRPDAPKRAEKLLERGVTAYNSGNLDKAIPLFEKSRKLLPENALILCYLGNSYRKKNQLKLARQMLEDAIVLSPDLATAYNILGLILDDLGEYRLARLNFESAIELEPNSADYLNNLAIVLARFGKFSKARQCYDDALALEPDVIESHIGRANLHHFIPGDPIYVKLLEQAKRPDLSPDHKFHMTFALAKAQQDFGNFDAAFKIISTAKSSLKKKHPFRPDLLKRQIGAIIDQYANPVKKARKNKNGPIPVFIVGMSRSGKTLLQEILNQSDQVYALDEDASLYRIMTDIIRNHGLEKQFPAVAADLTPEILREMGKAFRTHLEDLSDTAKYFILTSPSYYQLIGLIFETLPNAKVLHCLRQPLDIIIENYFFRYKTGNFHASDLQWSAQHWIYYGTMMAHWNAQYKDDIHLLSYEALVTKTDDTLTGIYDFLGLPYDSKKQDIALSDKSVNKWKNYASQLDPVRQALKLDT